MQMVDSSAMNFVAIDVETANPDMSSICQIGLAKFEEGKLVDDWVSYIDNDDEFYFANFLVHGIDADTVHGSPSFVEVYEKLYSFTKGFPCVSHGSFDRVSIQRALTKNDLHNLDVQWLDSQKIARRAWSEFERKGYGLKNVCQKIGHSFKHHDALEDAKAAGAVVLAASREKDLSISDWVVRLKQPIDPNSFSTRSSVLKQGNPDGDLFGEVLVFTGELDIARAEAAELAAELGCTVKKTVTKKTTILVVGDQDISKLAGKNRSNSHLKAEKLIAEGQGISILQESDFKRLVSGSGD